MQPAALLRITKRIRLSAILGKFPRALLGVTVAASLFGDDLFIAANDGRRATILDASVWPDLLDAKTFMTVFAANMYPDGSYFLLLLLSLFPACGCHGEFSLHVSSPSLASRSSDDSDRRLAAYAYVYAHLQPALDIC